MGYWTAKECLIVSHEYAQNYRKAKFKIGKDNKLKATKNMGTVLSFYKDVSEKLKENGFIRSHESIKGKEKQFIEWYNKFDAYIKQSGNGCLENRHYTIVTYATVDEESTAVEILENFSSAFNGTPKANPDILEMDDNTDNPHSLKQTVPKAQSKAVLSSDSVLKEYVTKKLKREFESEGSDEEFQESKKQKTLLHQDVMGH